MDVLGRDSDSDSNHDDDSISIARKKEKRLQEIIDRQKKRDEENELLLQMDER